MYFGSLAKNSIPAIFIFFLYSCAAMGPKETQKRYAPITPPKEPVVSEKGSLWDDGAPGRPLILSNRARGRGDLVTVVVSENASAFNEASTEVERDGDYDANVKALLGFGREIVAHNPNFSQETTIDAASSSSYKGGGKTTRQNKLTAKVTATIVEVSPEGNFYIEGKHEVVVNGEKQTVQISGIIRPEDIKADNSVMSSDVAEAKVVYNGKGLVAEKQNQGWLARILDVVWPM